MSPGGFALPRAALHRRNGERPARPWLDCPADPRGVHLINPPRAGRQQGSVSSGGCGGPLLSSRQAVQTSACSARAGTGPTNHRLAVSIQCRPNGRQAPSWTTLPAGGGSRRAGVVGRRPAGHDRRPAGRGGPGRGRHGGVPAGPGDAPHRRSAPRVGQDRCPRRCRDCRRSAHHAAHPAGAETGRRDDRRAHRAVRVRRRPRAADHRHIEPDPRGPMGPVGRSGRRRCRNLPPDPKSDRRGVGAAAVEERMPCWGNAEP